MHVHRALAGKLMFMHEQKVNELLAILDIFGVEGRDALTKFASDCSVEARSTMLPSGASTNVAVIPIYGAITHRGSFFSFFFGSGATVEAITQQLRTAVNDPTVSAIVLDIDSPGGDTDGVEELASEIFAARKQKPVVAVSNSLCASAAYYLASQASEVVVSPSSLTGSIGVYTLHEDDSQLLENAGVKVSLIKFGENKAEGNPFEPLSDSAREHLQEMVDTYGDAFEKTVARGRGLKQDDVHKKFGQGRVFDAKKAVRLGMADRVGTLDDVLAKQGAQRAISGRRADYANVTVVAIDAAAKKTKRVDDEDLEKDAFAYQGSDEPNDWHLPIDFSTEAKTKAHIRDAVARWNQTEMPDKDEKERARGRIRAAAKKHGIELSDDDLKGSSDIGTPAALEQARIQHELTMALLD